MGKHLLFFVGIFLLLTGCASTSHSVGEDYQFSPESKEGLIIISTRLDDRCDPDGKLVSSTLSVRSENSGIFAEGTLLMKNPLIAADFEAPVGYFFVKRLPVGKYYVDRFEYSSLKATGLVSDRSLEIPFAVAAGRAYYLGEVTVIMIHCAGFDVKVADQRRRDLALFSQRMKNISVSDVEPQILMTTDVK